MKAIVSGKPSAAATAAASLTSPPPIQPRACARVPRMNTRLNAPTDRAKGSKPCASEKPSAITIRPIVSRLGMRRVVMSQIVARTHPTKATPKSQLTGICMGLRNSGRDGRQFVLDRCSEGRNDHDAGGCDERYDERVFHQRRPFVVAKYCYKLLEH